MRLERVSPGGSRTLSGDGDDNSEEELASWADLRDQQTRFAQAGGFLGEF